jgi:hypothetical protein
MRQLHAPTIREQLAELRRNAATYIEAWGEWSYDQNLAAGEALLAQAEQQEAERAVSGLPF